MMKRKILALFMAFFMIAGQAQVMAAETEQMYVFEAYGKADENDFDIQNGVLVKYNGSDTEVVIPEGVTSIGNYAFKFCNGLTEVIIPGSVTNVGDNAFYACMGLTKVEIRNGVKSLGNYSFHACRNLTEIAIPESVESIKYQAFGECENLIIYGMENSYAQEYADYIDILFKPISEWENITVNIAGCQIHLSQSSFVYDGTEKEPVVIVKDGEKILALGTDYTLAYMDNRAVGNGKVTVTGIGAYKGTVTKTFEIKEPESSEKPVAVKKVTVKPKKLTLGVGETYQLKPTIAPANATNQMLTYEPSNNKVKVTSKGKITAKRTGKAKVTVKASNGIKAVVNIVVKKAPSKITLNAKQKTLKVGKTFQIKVKLPKNTASNKLTFTSNKKFVAAVSLDGKVTAKKKGTATITVKTFNGKKAKLKITVKKK